ncbi:hypothetical protein WMF04_03935 [Sorangium sp. So ce260]|uniref:hypothetical protein n=1 Tax=Sorangium sp. So ce260 TaxID=3133291 RepID=UPI003F61547C
MMEIKSHAEALALLRVIVEAKFHSNPDDRDVPGSSVLAALAVRIRESVVAEEIRREGAVAAERWSEWSRLGPSRPEWAAARDFAASSWREIWGEWSEAQKRDAATVLLSPFEVDRDDLSMFLDEVGLRLHESESDE